MGNERARDKVIRMIHAERDRQDTKFGWIGEPKTILPSQDLWKKLAVVGEEFGEVAKAILEGDPIEHLHEELIQVAACCVAWVEADLTRKARHTWETVPVGWDVPGSGIVLRKSQATTPDRIYVTFQRYEPFSEEWTAGRLLRDQVPIALSSRGLIY